MPKKTSAPTWKIHPGEILKEEFLEPLEMTAYELAKRLSVPAPKIYDIVAGKRGITAETAVLLARFFGTTPRFWLNMQADYELRAAETRLARKLKKIQPRKVA